MVTDQNKWEDAISGRQKCVAFDLGSLAHRMSDPQIVWCYDKRKSATNRVFMRPKGTFI